MSALDDYKRARQKPQGTSAAGHLGTLFGMIVGVLICVAFAQYRGCDFGGDGGNQDHHQQVQPVDGGRLVFVSEKIAPTIAQDMLMRGMPEFCKSHGLAEGYLWLDDEDDASEKLIEYAKGKGVEPPLVVYVDKDKQIKRAAKWPADEPELEKFLK